MITSYQFVIDNYDKLTSMCEWIVITFFEEVILKWSLVTH